MLEFRCEVCNERLSASEGHSGKKIRCPKCKKKVAVPGIGKILLIKKEDKQPTKSYDSLSLESDTKVNSPSSEVDADSIERIFFKCPMCSEDLEVPHTLKGKSVLCPACNGNISVPIQGNIDNQQLVCKDEIRLMEAIKQCPSCGETILDIAKKCKHCGEFIDGLNFEE